MHESQQSIAERLQLLCSPEEYRPRYWRVMPKYDYAECPFCHFRSREQIDTYSLHEWAILPDVFKKTVMQPTPFSNMQRFNAIKRCPHFLGIHIFLNLNNRLPHECKRLENHNGELPFVTSWYFPDNIESRCVLHALPVCSIEQDTFVPSYTLFFLTYFNENPKKLKQQYYTEEWRRYGHDPEYYPAQLDSPAPDPAHDSQYDLRIWASKGKLGYLDFTPEQILKIGVGTELPEAYQTIEGYRCQYKWENQTMHYSTVTTKALPNPKRVRLPN